MEIVERYIYAVTRLLPQAQRAEVEKELRSDIQDMMEAEKGSEEARARKVVESLGRPAQLAMNYRGTKQYLIGPQWFGIYLDTLKKISLISLPIIIAVLVVVSMFSEETLIQRIVDIALGTAGALMQLAFWVTLAFVIVEHTATQDPAKNKALAWSADDLPELPIERDTKLSDNVANITFYAAMAVVVVLTHGVLGLNADGTHISFFNPELWNSWMWGILGLLVLLVGREAYVLKTGRNPMGLIVTKIALDVALIGLLAWLYLSDKLVNPAFASELGNLWNNGQASLEWIIGATLIIWAIGLVWDAVKLLTARRTNS